jgi:hypothetical protein
MPAPDEPLAAAQLTRLRARLTALGLSAADLAAAAGTTPGGRTVRELALTLIAWMRSRPRG